MVNNETAIRLAEFFFKFIFVYFVSYFVGTIIFSLIFVSCQFLQAPLKIMPCPKCKSKQVGVWHSLFTRKYFVECENCHLCGKSKLFKRRAIKSWNRMPGQIEEVE